RTGAGGSMAVPAFGVATTRRSIGDGWGGRAAGGGGGGGGSGRERDLLGGGGQASPEGGGSPGGLAPASRRGVEGGGSYHGLCSSDWCDNDSMHHRRRLGSAVGGTRVGSDEKPA